MSGTALASAAAIVVAAPTIVPTHDITIVGAPAPAKLSTAKYELTAITDITLQGVSDAFWFGWGGYIGDPAGSGFPDPYYDDAFDGNLFSSGVSGVLYYLTDQTLDSIVPNFDLDNYYFEIGTLAGGPNAGFSPWGAVIYVGTAQLFGRTSPIGIAAEAVFKNGLTNTFNGLVVALTSPIPVIGTVTSVFYTGFSNDPADPTFYGTGVPGLLAYASTVITGLLPGGVLPFAATKTAAATKTTAASPLAATATKAIETVTEKVDDGVAGSKTATEEDSSTADATPTATETKSDTGTTESATDTGKSTETTTDTTADTQNKPADTPTEASTDTSGQDSTAGTKGDASETPATSAKKGTGSSAAPKTGKKADNPLAKIGKRISDALSGGKKAKSSDAGSDTSGSTGGSESSGSTS